MVVHDILLSLVGHTGDVIAVKRDLRSGEVCGYEVSKDIKFISAAEKEVIDRTCILGFYYSSINAFVSMNRERGVTSLGSVHNDNVVGLYVRALCGGLEEVLDGYRGALLKVEQEVLSHKHYPLSKLQYHVSEYLVTFPALLSLIQYVEDCKQGPGLGLHGGQVCDYVYRQSLTGIPSVQTCFRRLLHHCHKVLLSQVSSWLVHGLLTDPYNEFFIQRLKSSSSNSADRAEEQTKLEDEEGEEDEEQEKLAEATFHFKPNLILQERDWDAEYSLRLSMLPSSYIPVPIAKKILFIGRAVCILQHPSISKYGLLSPSEQLSFAQSLHVLREKTLLDIREVDIAIDQVRTVVTRNLWELVVNKADLLGHLTSLKDHLLLARGEFFQCFLDESKILFSNPPGVRGARDMFNGPFSTAASKVGIEEESKFKLLSFRMDSPSFSLTSFHHKDFPKSTVGAGLVCNGSARRVGPCVQLTTWTASQEGAVWYHPRQKVSQGFTTKFCFQANPPPASGKPLGTGKDNLRGYREGFAFALQGDSMQVRAARLAEGERSGAVFGGFNNALVIEFVQMHTPVYNETTNSVTIFSHVSSRTQAGRSADAVTITNLGHTTGNQLPDLFDGSPRTVRIEYTAAPESVSVFFEPHSSPVLSVNINLRRIVPLENGMAWVGFTGATDDDVRHKSNALQLKSWELHETESKASGEDAWKRLRLEYKVDAPLDLVLLRENFDRYNALFQFLLQVKRVQIQLQQAWAPQMALKAYSIEKRAPLMPVLGLRSRMQFLIDNLQFYLQVDVLEVQHQALLQRIEESKDFQEVRKAHSDYLDHLTNHCFLRDRVIYKALSACFETCQDLCRLLEVRRTAATAGEVEMLATAFERHSCNLFLLVSRKTNLAGSTHLAQLIVRIDYNHYFTRLAETLGLKGAHLTGKDIAK